MNKNLKLAIDEAKQVWGLEHYTLQDYSIFVEKNIVSGHAYLLEMQWVIEQAKEAKQPEDSVLLTIHLDTKKLYRLFINGENRLTKQFSVGGNMESVIDWIEEKTGLVYGRQFMQTIGQNNEFYFHAAVDNIPVFPTGTIHVKCNEEGELVNFSIDGHFPSEEEIQWEPFDLTTDTMEKVAEAQCKLIELPVEEQQRWISAYHIPVHYVSNDGKNVILEEDLEKPEHYTIIDEILEWNEATEEPFEEQIIDLSLEVSEEQAFGKREPIDIPLTENEMEQTKQAALRFMRQVFSEDSGDWKLTAAWPDFGYIFAEVKHAEDDLRLMERRIKLILDRETMNVLNYIDNNQVLETMHDFKPAEAAVIAKEEAFAKLKQELDIIPVYVYNRKNKKYYLCGRAACPYGIEAKHGEKVPLNQNQR